ncbi:MAG: hypothetical protein U0169_19345 [Polyangiaceae bacterium]
MPGGDLLPLHAGPNGEGHAFRLADGTLTAFDANGVVRWEKRVGEGRLFGGFDLDGDGVVDVGIVRTRALSRSCGPKALNESWIDLVLGSTGQVFERVVAPLEDVCFSTTNYGVQQWVARSLLFGANSRTFVLVPQYQTTSAAAINPYQVGQAFVFRFENGAPKRIGAVFTPASPSFDGYAAARPDAHGIGTKHMIESHVPNGLVTTVAGKERLVFFTSGRVVQYDLETLRLVADYPYLTGGRTDIVGRNYGGIQLDPGDPTRLRLVTGTSAHTLAEDALKHAMTTDPWAGIERHVSVYDLTTNGIGDRFFSYAHDGGDAFQFSGRTAYPARSAIPAARGGVARTVFDVYAGGRWSTIVTRAGGVGTDVSVKDRYVWDVVDLDGDGSVEIVATTIRTPDQPDVPGYYYPRFETSLYHWDESATGAAKFVHVRTYADVIPKLVDGFSDGTTTDAQSKVSRASTVRSNGKLGLLVVSRTGAVSTVPVDGP